MSNGRANYGTSSASYAEVYTENVQVSSSEIGSPSTSDDVAWVPPVQKRMSEIRRLKNDWDGRGSASVPSETLAFAFSMLSNIMPPRAPAPAIVPLGDGGVQLVWYSRRGEVEVEIARPNQVIIFHQDRVADTEREWEASTDFRRLSDILWGLFRD